MINSGLQNLSSVAVLDLGTSFQLFATDVGETFESLLATVREQRGGTLWIGLILAAFTSSTVFQQVQGVLAAIFHVPETKRRTGPVGWLVSRALFRSAGLGGTNRGQ